MPSLALESLGLEDAAPKQEKVAILVGPNGSGKSNFLKALAVEIRSYRNLAVISNTAYDRFSGMRGFKRLSASRSGQSPKGVIKRAVAQTIDEPDSRFYQAGAILDYCGYQPRFGFRVARSHNLPFGRYPDRTAFGFRDFDDSVSFLERYDPREIIWIDQREPVLSFSRTREFAAVLRNEDLLRREGYIRDIQVYLQRHDGEVIELLHASSGELALISSLVYLITIIQSDPIILIDEPENSLHPNWQREYIDKILAAVAYRNATIIIATHAPLIVTGALAKHSDLVSVFQIHDGMPKLLNLSEAKKSAGNIEGVLWRAFDVITPANHFVSEEIVGVITQLERGEIGKEAALSLVNAMDTSSFDEKQHQFFGAVRELIDKVEAERRGSAKNDG